VAEHESIAVGVNDRDSPLIPIRVACGDDDPTRVAETSERVLFDRPAQVEDQEILFGGRWRCFTVGITHELEVPGRRWPADHQQSLATSRIGTGAIKDLKAETLDPESFCGLQIATRSSYAQRAQRVWVHGIITPICCMTRFFQPIRVTKTEAVVE
jgi:hypothetical protein